MCETVHSNLTFTTVEQKIAREYLEVTVILLTFTTFEQKIEWKYVEAYLRNSNFA